MGIDEKYSKTGVRRVPHRSDLQRQLDGIRTSFRDGKLHDFFFVTNGVFHEDFKKMVMEENLHIVRDWAELTNRLYFAGKSSIDRECLTEEEKRNIPSGKVDERQLNAYTDEVKALVKTYGISQIDLCEHVKYPGT